MYLLILGKYVFLKSTWNNICLCGIIIYRISLKTLREISMDISGIAAPYSRKALTILWRSLSTTRSNALVPTKIPSLKFLSVVIAMNWRNWSKPMSMVSSSCLLCKLLSYKKWMMLLFFFFSLVLRDKGIRGTFYYLTPFLKAYDSRINK